MSHVMMTTESSGAPRDSVPSLSKLALKACIRNVRSIVDVGDAPFKQVRSILLKVPSAQQLHTIETNSPQLQGRTSEMWRALIKRDIGTYGVGAEIPEPEDPSAWHELYQELRVEESAKIRRNVSKLTAKLQDIKDEAARHTLVQVSNSSMPKLPRAAGMRVEKRPTGNISRGGDPSRLHFGGGSRTKTTTGADVLNRARREAREMSVFGGRGVHSNLARPTHQLNARATQLVKAPLSMSRNATPGSSRAAGSIVRAPKSRSAHRPAAAANDNQSFGEARESSGKTPRSPLDQLLDDPLTTHTPKRSRSSSISSDSPGLSGSGENLGRMAKVPRLSPPPKPKAKKPPNMFMTNKRKPKPK